MTIVQWLAIVTIGCWFLQPTIERLTRLRVRGHVAWYDWWVGGYFDREKGRFYLMVPFVGLVFERRRP